MHPRLNIRPEQRQDAQSIRNVVRQAYADVGHSDHREHLMVERLRSSAAYIQDLSLVAEIDGEAVGHVMLTKIGIVDGARRAAALSLAPLSVHPAFQRQGVGDGLVRAAHASAKRLGHPFIVLVGPPEYYLRFGYQPLDDYPVTLPFEVAARQRMILPLFPRAMEGVRGRVEYAPEWLDH